MNRTILNKHLTPNFTLYEFIEAQLPPQAQALNWKHIDRFDEKAYTKLAQYLQRVRNLINIEHRGGNGGSEIGLRITSGWRCREWEHLRGRSGESQHTIGAAADIQPIGVNDIKAAEIMFWLWDMHWPRATGHQGGFAMKRPEYKDGKIVRLGFLHYDLRPSTARWSYS